jgi:hypothetical protein
LVTVIGPKAPAAAPPTEIPGPKLANVAPWKKKVNFALIVTATLLPTCPDAGFNEVIEAGGLIVTADVLPLVKLDVPSAVVPDTETL